MNVIVVLIFISYVVALLSLQYFKINSERYRYIARKGVHLTTGLIIFFLTLHFAKQTILILIATGTIFSIITYNLKKFNFIHTTSGMSMGTLFYPIGILVSFILLYNMPLYYFQISLLILSVSDTIANLCGEIKKWNIRFIVFQETKSIFGVAGFAASAYLIHLILLPDHQSVNYSYIFLSVIAAINFEIVSFRGSDNFTIPAGCSLFFLATQKNGVDSIFIILLILFTASGAFMLNKKNILTRYGSVAAYMLGIYFFSVLGKAWSIPVVFFFITSVIFTKINGIVNRKANETNIRNIWQVCANIFFAVASSAGYLLTENVIFIYFYITLVATVTSDTWASEIGPVFSKKCFSLSDFRFQNSGISGGVSLPGTIAAAGGSLLISVISYYLFFRRIDMQIVFIIAIAGFAGSLVDSLLSAFLEPVLMKMNFFNNKTGSDLPSPNDIINLTASLSAPFIFILLWMTI